MKRAIIKTMRHPKVEDRNFDKLLTDIVKVEKELKTLPELSTLEKATLEHSRALEHLYNSSRIEGTHLTKEGLNSAVHGTGITPTEK